MQHSVKNNEVSAKNSTTAITSAPRQRAIIISTIPTLEEKEESHG